MKILFVGIYPNAVNPYANVFFRNLIYKIGIYFCYQNGKRIAWDGRNKQERINRKIKGAK